MINVHFRIGVPQIIILALYLFAIISSAAHHGEPENGSTNVWVTLISVGIELSILIWGGFFS